MPVKRSRIGRSSSFGGSGILPPPVKSADGWINRRAGPSSSASAQPPPNSSKPIDPSVVEPSLESRPRILGLLTLSPPVQESVVASDKEPVGGYVDKCYSCNKKICEDAAVFMYSSLPFCTVECRDREIGMDSEREKLSGKTKGKQFSPSG